MSEYFQFLHKPERVESFVENFLDRVEERLPERANINAADASYQRLARLSSLESHWNLTCPEGNFLFLQLKKYIQNPFL